MAVGRVTESSIHSAVLNNLQRTIQKGQQIQEQLSSGKQINRPSDSPTGTVTSMELRGDKRVAQQYARNADDGMGWLFPLLLIAVAAAVIAVAVARRRSHQTRTS